jgi:glyoxylase-like metal-dependent hydrolase (beta-lactamase superfamily II)
MEIAPHVHCISGMIANLYLIDEPEGLTLIDAGTSGSSKRVLQVISDLGRTPQELRRIIITHSDGDHVGGLAALKAATGARVYASKIEADAIATGRPSRELRPPFWFKPVFALVSPMMRIRAAQVDEFIEDGYTFPVLGGLRVLATPGHTPGHISLFAPAAGILFVGDSLVARKGKLQGSSGMVNWDLEKANASVRKQAALAPRIVCSGHGAVIADATGKFPLP